MAEPEGPIREANVIPLMAARPSQDRGLREPVQLSLDFDEPHKLFVIATEHLHGATFIRRLYQSKPKVILDLRFAPHFNFGPIDGRTIKQQIAAVGAQYLLHSVPFHEIKSSLLKHDPALIASRLSDCISETGSAHWPVMVLIKDRGIAIAFSPYLVGALSKHPGGRWMTEMIT